ncbi:hypothetical protein N4562_06275 [Ligilactobacillus agilis]|uniref:Uncharacterized protein n=1 Tax=Ligilactobacillus agilis TaxID=1601 RepID=A0A9Q9MZP6_9LACO|nr:hypothetical protein [Ligilactobacillus agilis]UXC62705.1 hypothetical protein N4562_06275 [Ligilactobacillus agilis]
MRIVKSSQVKSSQVKSSQVKSSQVKSSQVKSSQVKSSQVKSSQVKSSQVDYVNSQCFFVKAFFNSSLSFFDGELFLVPSRKVVA